MEFKGTKELKILHSNQNGFGLGKIEKPENVRITVWDNTEESKANAIIISKAYEMLEALQGVIRLRDLIDYDESIVNESNIGEASALNQMLNRIDSLIKEATEL